MEICSLQCVNLKNIRWSEARSQNHPDVNMHGHEQRTLPWAHLVVLEPGILKIRGSPKLSISNLRGPRLMELPGALKCATWPAFRLVPISRSQFTDLHLTNPEVHKRHSNSCTCVQNQYARALKKPLCKPSFIGSRRNMDNFRDLFVHIPTVLPSQALPRHNGGFKMSVIVTHAFPFQVLKVIGWVDQALKKVSHPGHFSSSFSLSLAYHQKRPRCLYPRPPALATRHSTKHLHPQRCCH